MDEVKIISKQSISGKPSYISDAKLIRAEFRQNNKLGEGYFYIVTADVFGLGYGMMFTGITAPKGLLDLIVPSLLQSFKSFTVSSDYVDVCIKAQNNAAAGALKAGKILDHTSNSWVIDKSFSQFQVKLNSRIFPRSCYCLFYLLSESFKSNNRFSQ